MSPRDEAMPPAFLERVAEQFKALSDPVRLSVLNALFEGEKAVGHLADEVGSSIANVSKHLAVLHAAGWVRRTRDGTSMLYSLADDRTAALCELMCARVRERAAKEAEFAQPPVAGATARKSSAGRAAKSSRAR
jgi:DNA-binding transcriptional ArsR family regulator